MKRARINSYHFPVLVSSTLSQPAPPCVQGEHASKCHVCVFIPSPVREGSTLFGDHRVSIFQTELKPVRRVSADANLKRFQLEG